MRSCRNYIYIFLQVVTIIIGPMQLVNHFCLLMAATNGKQHVIVSRYVNKLLIERVCIISTCILPEQKWTKKLTD